ncbi:phage major tail tube protein [Acidithiobacillus caldus]|uniref:Phage major tail tube protein n=1 Tax=Acidithiobacillus caldus (strain ATCC 51756 / DSM 8584 / KU) TaxID=637389 RepID=A0A059ZVN4_ACICK|nr:phage major tail tube protein [Acidithiobacillus caldus]AFU62901.1 phage tail tube protein FII [Acidithiobacillus phage AcaML1]AIA54031.1 Phage major tail tube protein [Acidithiobacillus caldus ATCC 51756]MBU2729851.1 phage major tail tube protein [Acidithiobacillus caldus]MBU2736774.1 phage major tail tube protein [Acidithiobacillus caldus ATCC 51756]MBU2743888.1 phage major tail tube protein [Acidithiobacillus caldus]
MPIQLPRVLKNMNLFVDGRGYAGRIDEIQLPKLTLKTEEHRAGGMDVPVEIDLGMDKLEAELTISDYDPEVYKLFGLLDLKPVQITIRGAIQAQGEDAKPVVVNLRGGWREIDAGTWKPGDKSTLKVSVAASYYKLTIDGQEVVEVDAINLVRKVGGVDQINAIRAAIGL